MTRGVRERSAMLVAGSRTSQLARAQTASVISLLQQANPHLQFDLRLYSTRGDRELDAPLPTIGGKGLFTEQLEKALRDGEIDFAVHSLKDLPVDDAYGLVTAAILARSDPSDVLVTRDGTTLSELPQGAVIGTSSLRRQAQLLAQRPDLRARSIRGNVETRIRKVEDGEYDGVVLASAGIARLGLSGISMTHFSPEAMLPAPGQGALAVQCRSDDERTLSLLRAIDDAGLRAAVTAERTFLSHLGAGCSAPVAALAGVESDNGPVSLRGRVLSVDGSRVIDVAGTGTDPRELGTRLAKEALDRGAAGLMPPSAALPLARRRVCVTRTPEQALELIELLEERGAETLLLPAIRIVPAPDAAGFRREIERIDRYRWLLFASTNGVRQFFERLGSTDAAEGGARALPPTAAVGTTTASALAEHGVETAFLPSAFTGECIGRELPVKAGERVLIVTAQSGNRDAERLLAERGAEVTRLPLYSTEPAPIEPEMLADLERRCDAILFLSGSAAASFHKALTASPGLRERIESGSVSMCCVGPSTSAALQRLELPVHVVAETHTARGLVDALCEHYGAERNGRVT